jgi:oxygen-independent coproporphyrinogen III oxidase
MAGIYLHIPFCKQACYYCDFHFSTNLSAKNELIAAMRREITLQASYLNEPVRTIYFGGGTPSLASDEELASLLNEIYSSFQVTGDAEITLEANPDDLTPEKLQHLKQIGINRLSVGIQSFDDPVLKFLNRAHDGPSGSRCIHDARAAGFDNISIDLIYAIPSQPLKQWVENVRTAINLRPEHISAYSLTIEEKTVFGRWAQKGKMQSPDEIESAEQLEMLIDLLESAGYEHYEISNFALPGYYSRHNSSYWRQQKYVGIGPSAHSFNGLTRQYNVANNYQYIKSIREGEVPSSIEILTRLDHINDYLLTTLRTSWGSDLNTLQVQFNYDLLNERKAYIQQLINGKLAVIEDGALKLTKQGRFVADKIASDLFVVPVS